ncbi:GNAT family N-acetyltransferase [Hymenobacter sp. J193]|uniref:GNAT family N-acetyltransferase n=1 Tax=Hymenobacter sp. J193 TaxID=2898429 RepID=UPI0021514763|nr:GNAT family protein [Hymenobacter sp. J193]MCR5887759.1 GNAT family N-acetyltransferase [Hymenobacter sp. J193]
MTAAPTFLPGLTQLPTLTTRRLRLCWLTPADVPALFTIFSDPAVMRYWSREAFTSPTEAAELQTQIETLFRERSLFQWGLTRLTDDEVIGTATLYGLHTQHRHAGVGYALGSAHWGQGYASEALAALLEFAFTELSLHRLEADVDPRNTASRRCLEKQGFREEGLQRERYFLYNEWQDAQLFGLLRSKYQTSLPG